MLRRPLFSRGSFPGYFLSLELSVLHFIYPPQAHGSRRCTLVWQPRVEIGNCCSFSLQLRWASASSYIWMISRRLAYNRAFYRQDPEPGHRYRQIAILEENEFQVCIFEGDVIQTDPTVIAMRAGRNVRSHPALEEAMADAEKELRKSVAGGWIRYRFTTPVARDWAQSG